MSSDRRTAAAQQSDSAPNPSHPPGRGTRSRSVENNERGVRPEEIERLFREHNAALLRFIAARLGSSHDASEVAQEAYVRLLSLDHPETISYVRAFLFKIAANLATDRLRQRVRRSFVVETNKVDVAAFELSPDRQVEGEQAIQRLRIAIDELPPKCREAFLLYRLEGMSCQEVAVRLGLHERMVWLYVARALEYLRDRVTNEAPQDQQDCEP